VQDVRRPAPVRYYFWTPKHRMPLSQGQVAAAEAAADKSSRAP
jgi:hypothetical protein